MQKHPFPLGMRQHHTCVISQRIEALDASAWRIVYSYGRHVHLSNVFAASSYVNPPFCLCRRMSASMLEVSSVTHSDHLADPEVSSVSGSPAKENTSRASEYGAQLLDQPYATATDQVADYINTESELRHSAQVGRYPVIFLPTCSRSPAHTSCRT